MGEEHEWVLLGNQAEIHRRLQQSDVDAALHQDHAAHVRRIRDDDLDVEAFRLEQAGALRDPERDVLEVVALGDADANRLRGSNIDTEGCSEDDRDALWQGSHRANTLSTQARLCKTSLFHQSD